MSDLSNGKGVVDLLVFSHVEAQLHFLQALLSLGFTKLFSEGHFVLAARLPSLIGWILYLFSCWKITDQLKSKVLEIVGFIALCSHAYVLDYFSVARGYGLSMGLAAISIYFFIKSISKTRTSPALNNRDPNTCTPNAWAPNAWAILSIWTASFAVLTNLALMNFYAGMAVLCAYTSIDFTSFKKAGFIKTARSLFITNGYLFANAALLFTFYLPRVLLMIRANQLYFGGTTGFAQDTVASLITASFYQRDFPGSWPIIFAYLLVAASLAMSISLLLKIKKGANTPLSIGVYCSAIINTMAIFNISGFYFANVKFLIERTALGFVLLFILQVIFFVSESTRVFKTLGYTMLIFCMALGIHGLNLHRTSHYCAYSQTPELLNDLIEIHKKTGQMVILGVTDSTKYTLGWYAEKQAGLQEHPQTKKQMSAPIKQFEWLVIYSVDYGVPPNGKLHYHPKTTHIALQHYIKASQIQGELTPLKEYPYARTHLYEVKK
jgi:hypothetical protein